MKLQVADEVLVWPLRERGETVYRIEVPSQNKFYRIGYREYFLMSLLDGQCTLPQACSIATARLRRDAPTADESNTIVRWLIENGIVHEAGAMTSPTKHAPTKPLTQALMAFNPFWLKIPLPRVERPLHWVASKSAPLLSPVTVAIGIALMMLAGVLFVTHRNEFMSDGVGFFHPSRWMWITLAFVGLKTIHELGHAIACGRQGCRVRQCGAVFVLFVPLAFVDVTSCWRLESRARRMCVSAAGMLVELVIASLAMIVWTFSDDALVRSVAESVVITAGLSTILFNANVLMRFDGYYLLADLIDIPNLAAEAQSTLRRLGKRLLLGVNETRGTEFVSWRRGFVLVYAIAAAIWKWLICITLLIAASTLFHGAGIVLVLIGATVWFVSPIVQLYQFIRRLHHTDRWQCYRGLIVSSMIAFFVGAVVFWIPIPTSVRVPVMTQWSPSTRVRIQTDGFVDAIFVLDDEYVQARQPLIKIRNDELTAQQDQLEAEGQAIKVHLRAAAGAGDEAKVMMLKQDAIAVQERIQSTRERINSLLVRAPEAGRVICPNIEQLRGTFASEGQFLLSVVGPADQEWVALVATDQVRTVRRNQDQPVIVRMPDGRRIPSEITRIDPRASDRLFYPALAAINGGTLPTTRDPDQTGGDPDRLMEPYFQAWLTVPERACDLVPTGMRLIADCGDQRETIAKRLVRWICQFVTIRRAAGRQYSDVSSLSAPHRTDVKIPLVVCDS